MRKDTLPLWTPTEEFRKASRLWEYMRWLKKNHQLDFADYDALWQWSVDQPSAFWQSFWNFAGIISHHEFSTVMQKPALDMIGTRWFEGATLNYAEHIFKNASEHYPAIIFSNEVGASKEISWATLYSSVARLAGWMKSVGVIKGDRVVSVMPNIPETVIAFLATQSIGAIWSSCSPDFGNASIVDRFLQVEAKILFVTDGYQYNGKIYPKIPAWEELRRSLPSLQKVVYLPYADENAAMSETMKWGDIMQRDDELLSFEPVPFDHPLWILYSSGTTGKPKAITHRVGGNLLEHLKVLLLHWDVRPGERFFWYSTTGWMMWNFSVASLLTGATLVIYDGSAAFPDLNCLWHLARELQINHFGGGAAFFIACMKAGMHFREDQFPHLQTIGSTGSPLPPEAFEWIYRKVKSDLWLISFSGGTDICSGFVGGCPLLPVYPGEIQCRLLGCHLEAFDEKGKPLREALGEMVILEPMPSMPIFFWGDKNNERYHSSYFEHYAGVWRHGDWIEITSRNTVIIFGRSDATLNRDGVRIGTSEVYSAVDQVEEVADSLVVCIEKEGGQFYMPLFVVMKEGHALTEDIMKNIKNRLRTQYSPRHVPDDIIAVSEIPYTISGKKMESPVKKILMGMPVEKEAMKNPNSLREFEFFIIR